MGYPSLLYKVAPRLQAMDISVFEDLQLLNFMPKSVANTVKIPCREENIRARQELFASLFNPEAREVFERLYELCEDICDLHEVYKDSRCEFEKHAVYLFLMGAQKEFAIKASSADFKDALSSRFAASFAREMEDKRYLTMRGELDSLLPELEKALHFSVRSHSQSISLGRSVETSYLERIKGCAATLGLDSKEEREVERRRISPDLINALAAHYPTVASDISSFYSKYKDLYLSSVTYYLKELGFYLTMLRLFDRVRDAGIPISFPEIKEGVREIRISEAYDISLLAKNENNIIPNDIEFTDNEPFFYLTGANGGGKTTYLRTVGICAVLYLNGCPLPCIRAEIGGLDSVFTHFPRDERQDGSGRFVEENGRVEAIKEKMGSGSLLLLNETYSTTNEENAVRMTEKLANELFERSIFGLYITHQHSLSESAIPYLNVLIDKDDENRRTFKIARQKGSGGSFAQDILKRYDLTLDALEKRFGKL